jgi:hypothetical protein
MVKTPAKASTHGALRVRKETRKLVMALHTKLNKKDFGSRVPVDTIIQKGVALLTALHLHEIQEASLSNKDRLDRDYRLYVAKHGGMAKDVYLGKRLDGSIVADADEKPDAKQSEGS